MNHISSRSGRLLALQPPQAVRSPSRSALRVALSARFAFSALGIFLALTGSAAAQTTKPVVNCVDPTATPPRTNVVYAAGSTALRPFLGSIAPILAAAATPYTIVYQSQGSCTGVDALYSTDPKKHVLADAVGNWAVYYDAAGASHECWLDLSGRGDPTTFAPATPNYPNVDLGVSDVFAASCGYSGLPAGITIADYPGPIQPMTFIVNSKSKETSISADAAYLAFGLGGGPGVATGDMSKPTSPWSDPTQFYVRNSASGTQQMLSRAIGVPATSWWGVNKGSSGAVVSGLLAVDPALADKAIGIVSTDLADANRGNLRILALKSRGQSCGYLPDSTITTKDKINVRDGHYPVWGPVHFFAQTSNGQPNAAASAFVSVFNQPHLDISLLTAISSRGLVPQCAMKVTRSTELGDMSPFKPDPAASCSCSFEKIANGGTTCKACASVSDCPNRGACNYGFCEPQ